MLSSKGLEITKLLMSTKQQGNTNEKLKLKYDIGLIQSIYTTCKYLGVKRGKFLKKLWCCISGRL